MLDFWCEACAFLQALLPCLEASGGPAPRHALRPPAPSTITSELTLCSGPVPANREPDETSVLNELLKNLQVGVEKTNKVISPFQIHLLEASPGPLLYSGKRWKCPPLGLPDTS